MSGKKDKPAVMKDYEMLAPVTLHEGHVRLTAKQAKGRAHKLEKVEGKKDVYRITGPNQFKAGQVIGYDGEIPKAVASDVVDPAEVKAQAAAAADEGGNGAA